MTTDILRSMLSLIVRARLSSLCVAGGSNLVGLPSEDLFEEYKLFEEIFFFLLLGARPHTKASGIPI